MRFNAAGDAATGVAGGTIGVNGAVPTGLTGILGGGGTSHGPSWLTAGDIVFQSLGVGGIGPAVLAKYNISGATLTTLDAAGNNDCAAGNAIWATYLVGTGVKTNNGLGTIAGAGLGDVSQDFGELVLINTFPNVIGLTVYNAAGVAVISRPTNVLTSGNVRMRGHIAAYQNSGAWVLDPVASSLTYANRIQEPINWITPLVLAASGTVLLLERSDRLTLRYARNGQGWEIVGAGVEYQYNPDLVEVAPNVVRMGWCTTSGEAPSSLHLAELNVSTGALRYAMSFTAGVPNWQASTVATPLIFPVGPAGVTANGGTGAAPGSLVVPYQAPVADQSGRISRPYYDLLTTYSRTLGGLGATVAAIPPAGVAPPGTPGSPGTNGVTASSVLTLNQLVLGADGSVVKSLGSGGTTTTVLHGNAAGAPTFGAVALATDVSGDLPYANLTPSANASRLLGRTSASAGDWQEISLSADLALALTVLGLGSGRSLVRRTSTPIANAAIKTLQSAPVPIVAGPGGGFRLVLIQCDLEVKIATPYTGIDAAAYLVLALDTNEISNYIGNDATTTPALTGVDELLSTNARSNVQLVPYSQVVDPATQAWGNVAIVKGLNFDGMTMYLTMSNGAVDLGGGAAGNSMTLHTYYMVEAVIA